MCSRQVAVRRPPGVEEPLLPALTAVRRPPGFEEPPWGSSRGPFVAHQGLRSRPSRGSGLCLSVVPARISITFRAVASPDNLHFPDGPVDKLRFPPKGNKLLLSPWTWRRSHWRLQYCSCNAANLSTPSSRPTDCLSCCVLPILGNVGWYWFAWVNHPTRCSRALSECIYPSTPVATYSCFTS